MARRAVIMIGVRMRMKFLHFFWDNLNIQSIPHDGNLTGQS
jgi:hypothetical protein